MQNRGKDVWIGLFTTATDNRNFFWVDNSAVDFLNWRDGEPNNQGDELCVEMFHDDGAWNDAPCTPYYGERGYLCKAPKSKHFEFKRIPFSDIFSYVPI